MAWNWTQPGGPHFAYDPVTLEPLERRFLLLTGEVIGAVRHVSEGERNLLRIELLSDEAVKTSAIEGETLDRLSVQSSLRRQLGLDADNRNVKPKERGIAEMMVDLYRTWADPPRRRHAVPLAPHADGGQPASGDDRRLPPP